MKLRPSTCRRNVKASPVAWQPNHSQGRVRMAQHIPMYPANESDVVDRAERVRLWRELDSPKRDAFPGDPREWEKSMRRRPS